MNTPTFVVFVLGSRLCLEPAPARRRRRPRGPASVQSLRMVRRLDGAVGALRTILPIAQSSRVLRYRGGSPRHAFLSKGRFVHEALRGSRQREASQRFFLKTPLAADRRNDHEIPSLGGSKWVFSRYGSQRYRRARNFSVRRSQTSCAPNARVYPRLSIAAPTVS